jgi:hypothetical protein
LVLGDFCSELFSEHCNRKCLLHVLETKRVLAFLFDVRLGRSCKNRTVLPPEWRPALFLQK